MANDRKQIFSFTADQELIDQAKIVATVLDKNFSQFVCEAIQEKIDASQCFEENSRPGVE